MSQLEPASVSELVSRLSHLDQDVAREAVREIGRRNATEAAPELLRLLRVTPNHGVRNAAALALSDMRIPEAFDAIVELLRDERTTEARGTLLYALQPYDCNSIIALLADLVVEGGFEVSWEAARLMINIEGKVKKKQALYAWNRLRQAYQAAETLDRKEQLEPLLEGFDHESLRE